MFISWKDIGFTYAKQRGTDFSGGDPGNGGLMSGDGRKERLCLGLLWDKGEIR
jgi:hypothetical protein